MELNDDVDPNIRPLNYADQDLNFFDAVEGDINQFFSDEGIEDRKNFLLGLLSAKKERGELYGFVLEHLGVFSTIIDKLGLPLVGSARIDYVYDRFSRIFYPESNELKFSELDMPLPTLSKEISFILTFIFG